MAKSKTRKFWITGTVFALIVSGILFFPQTNTLGASATPTITPMATAIISTCLVGLDPDCLEKPNLVPDSNGAWAYYIYNNIYFEYPSFWQIQQRLGDRSALIISPAPDSSEGMNFSLIALMFITDLRIENWDTVFTTSQPAWERANTEWKQFIYLDDFKGFECLWQYSNAPATDLEFFLYNESKQISVGLLARTKDNNVADLMDNPDTTNKMFPNIQHIVQSIRIWKHARDEHQIGISVINYHGHKNPP